MTKRNQRSFNLDQRGVADSKSVIFAMAGLVVLAGATAGYATDQVKDTGGTEKVLKTEIEVISQDKVRVTPLVGNPLPTKHLRVHVTFPEQNKSGITVKNLKGATEKTQVATQTVTENITVGVKHEPVYKNVSVPGVGVKKKLDHYKEHPVTRNVTRKKTSYRFNVDEWHNNSDGGGDTVEAIGGNSTSFFSPIPGLGNEKKRTLASNVVSGVGGSFNADNPNMWSTGESFVVDLQEDIINESDIVRVQVYDTRSEKRVLDKAARAQGLPYTGFEFGDDETSDENLKTKPTAEIYGPNTTVPNQEVTFTLEADDIDGTIEEIVWSNGQKGSTADYTFTESPGAYVGVSATVIDDDGNTTGAKHTLRIVEPENVGPEVTISGPSEVEFGSVVSYDASVSDVDGTVTSIDWSTGDSGPQSSVSFFGSPGETRTISVTAQDDDGATTKATKTIRVTSVDDTGSTGGNQAPKVSISGPSSVDAGDTGSFSVSASDPDGHIESIEWSNGGTGSSETIGINGVVGETQTVSVTVTDNDGASTTETTNVQITEPPLSGTIYGPSKVVSGDKASFSVSATEPISSVSWDKTSPATLRDTDSGTSASFHFDADPGETATLSVEITDTDGDTVAITREVKVISDAVSEPKIHNVDVDAQNCLPPEKPTTIFANVNDPSPSGKIETVRWFDELHTDPIASGKEITYTPAAAPGSQTSIAVKAWNNNGESTTTTITETVCEQQAKKEPEITVMKAAIPDADTQSSPNYFETDPGFSQKLFRFTAHADTQTQGAKSYVWKFPNGDVKKTTGSSSSVLYNFESEIDNGASKTVTLLVTDGNGQTKTMRKTINFVEDHRSLPDGSTVPDFRFSGSDLRTGEAAELTYSPSYDKFSGLFSFQVSWGDGSTDTVLNQDPDSPINLKHAYDTAGDYTIQVHSLDNQGNLVVGKDPWTTTVTVDGGQYTVYHYKSEVVTEQTVASSAPGPLWTEIEYHHTESELISEKTKDLRASQNFRIEQHLMNGWRKDGSHYEAVHVGYYEQSDWQSPGADWFKVEDDIGTTSVRDGWSYEVYDDKQDDSGHAIDGGTPGTYVGKVKDHYETTKTTESASSPGYEWSRGDQVGTTRTGWDYYWRDDEYSGWSSPTLVDTRRDKVESRTTDTRYKCENYVTGSTSWSGSSCGPYETQVATDTDVDPAVYDTDYQYREGEYDDVYEWHKTVTRYDYDYKYKFKDYRQETLHLWNKKKYEQKLFQDLHKPEYNTTMYYVYEKGGTTTQMSLDRPAPSIVQGDLEKTTHTCGNPDAPLQGEAC